MRFEAGHRTKGIAGALTVAGRDAADVIFFAKANGVFAGAAFFPERCRICVHTHSVRVRREKIHRSETLDGILQIHLSNQQGSKLRFAHHLLDRILRWVTGFTQPHLNNIHHALHDCHGASPLFFLRHLGDSDICIFGHQVLVFNTDEKGIDT